MLKNIIDILFPMMSLQRKILKKILVKLHLKSSFILGYYNTWMQQHQMYPVLVNQSRDLSNAPLISIVVPAFNTPERYLNDLLYSIISQAYENWELILVNASNEPNSIRIINNCSNRDKRIKVINVKNAGISKNTNIGINAAAGEYIAFCDHDDTLEPFALYEVVLKIIDEKPELIYSDEDKLSEDGRFYNNPHFKPDWSPDLLTHVNYINHLTVIKKSLLNKVGLLNPEMDGAQDYDLILRVLSEKPKISHISKVLYHWRVARNSTALDFSSKKNITKSGEKALVNYFNRAGLKVEVKSKEFQPGHYELIFNEVKKISIIITPFTSCVILELFLKLLLNRTNLNSVELELLVPEGVNFKTELNNIKIKTFKKDKDFLKNAVDNASFNRLIIFNQIALPDTRDWASRLCSVLIQNHVKAVSPLIVQDGEKIYDCGLVLDDYGNYTQLFKAYSIDKKHRYTNFGNIFWVRNVDALTGGITAVRKKQFKNFLSKHNPNISKAIFNFSSQKSLYNTIYTEVVMNSQNIYFSSDNPDVIFFNKNLITNSDNNYHLYSSESVAMNILMDIANKEGLTI